MTWSNNGGLGIKGELLSRYLMFYGSVCNNIIIKDISLNYALNYVNYLILLQHPIDVC